MQHTVFSDFATVRYEGEASKNPLAYRYYDADQIVMGKRLEEHLRFAVAYWHSLVMNGSDPFGAPTIHRPWMTPGEDPMTGRTLKSRCSL